MPKKKTKESQEDQSKRFEAEVRRRIAAGELNPTEAEEQLERAMRKVVRPKSASS